MKAPRFKVDIAGTEYESVLFSQIQVKRPENGVSSAVLLADNMDSHMYTGKVDHFNEVKIYFKEQGGGYTQVFGGYVRQLKPYLGSQKNVQIFCKGYGQALADTHCNADYGKESSNDSLHEAKDMWDDLVDNYINKGYGGGATGYAITKTNISDLSAGTSISYINNPYRKCVDVVNNVCNIVTAIRAGSAGPHWFVDTSKNLRIDFIGTGQVGWTAWYNTDAAGSTFAEGVDFHTYQTVDKTDEFANSVMLVTDLRKPAYDYWTEDSGGAALWTNSTLDSVTDDNAAGHFVVGSHSLKFDPNGAAGGRGYYPCSSLLTGDAASGQKNVAITDATNFNVGDTVFLDDDDSPGSQRIIASIAGNTLTMDSNLLQDYEVAQNALCAISAQWNVTEWGSERTIPTVNFYYLKSDCNVNFLWICLEDYSTNLAQFTDYFYATYSNWTLGGGADPDDAWIHISLPIGPYYSTVEVENKPFRWSEAGSPDWNTIDAISFYEINANPGAYWLIDDLHFKGQIAREATNSTSIAANNEIQKVFLSRVTMDDSAVANVDRGTAARIAYAELLRRQKLPVTITFPTRLRADLLPGQKIHVHACKTASGFNIDSDMRCLMVQHNLSKDRGITTVTATDDLLNSFPVSTVDQYELMTEYLLLDNREALNMRAGSEVDLLVTPMTKDYP